MFAPKDRSPLRTAAVVLAAGACTALLGACASTPGDDAPVPGAVEILRDLQPADIAVAPLRNQTGGPDLPEGLLRAALSRTLLERFYSPLDLGYVDGNWVESSFRGTPAPDALLVVVMDRWDEDDLFVTGKVEAKADLFLFQGGTTTGTVLWSTRFEGSVDLRDGRATPPAPSPLLIPKAAEIFAQGALATLPVRDPIAAHAGL